jgi:hypothetical protein
LWISPVLLRIGGLADEFLTSRNFWSFIRLATSSNMIKRAPSSSLATPDSSIPPLDVMRGGGSIRFFGTFSTS